MDIEGNEEVQEAGAGLRSSNFRMDGSCRGDGLCGGARKHADPPIWRRLKSLSFFDLAGFPHPNYLPDSAVTVYGIRGILRVGEAG